ncbi:MAG: hypothetical protein ACRDZN_01045 [Acidimicrobiales bacterium]
MGTSSANPFMLGRYSGDGLALVAALKTKSDNLAAKLGTLRASGSPYVPALAEPDATLTDLAGDWHHLDEFAGDVANAFFQANQNLGERPLTQDQMNAMVLTMGDDSILRLSHVGYADRDGAIAAANQLTADIQAALEDGGISAEELDGLADRAGRGQFDPAFSVRFVENMGVDGMARIPALIEAAWPGGNYGDNPGWGQDRLVPFAGILTTAMDTRSATPQIDRHDPDNQDLADGDRLDETWVDEFTSFWEADDFRQPNNFHYSLLVKNAELPDDVLVDVANHQLDYLLAHDARPTNYMNGIPWGLEDSTAEVNILDALGANDDASLEWLGMNNPGDGTIFYPGRTATNMELLLRYDPNTVDPQLGGALAAVVDNGLQHWDDGRSDDLFDVVVDTVADQGTVHFDQLLPTLGEGAREHMDQLADRTNRVPRGTVGNVDQNAQQALYDAHDFLKVLMDDDEAATSVYRGSLEFVQDTLNADTGDGFGGESLRIGGLMGLVTEADENAAVEATEARIAARQSFLDGVGLVKDVVGLVPVAGPTASSAISIGSFALDQTIDNFGMSGLEGAADQTLADMANVRDGIRAELTNATVAYEYGVRGTWTSSEVIEHTSQALGGDASNMDTDFFADGTTGDRRPIKPYAEMSAEEQQAYIAWINSDPVGDAIASDLTAAEQRMDSVIDSLEQR